MAPEWINHGNTQKFPDLAKLTAAAGGRTQFSVYRSKPIDLPFRIRLLERHPLGSQAFYPLHGRPFPVIVAAVDGVPAADTIRVFLTNGQQGVNIRAGVWHHYQLSLEQESDYVVIDRQGPGPNHQEFRLDKEVLVRL